MGRGFVTTQNNRWMQLTKVEIICVTLDKDVRILINRGRGKGERGGGGVPSCNDPKIIAGYG